MNITRTSDEIVFDIERQYPTEKDIKPSERDDDYQNPSYPVLRPAKPGTYNSIFHDFTHYDISHYRSEQYPNVVGNTNIRFKEKVFGDQATDYLQFLYSTYPEAFNGSGERAFKNRQSVFNLTLNLLTEDYYSFYKDKYIKLYALNLFQDILTNIGLGRTIEDKPRYSLALHKELISDYINVLYIDEYSNYNASNSIHGKGINVELKGTVNNNLVYKKFSDVVSGEANPNNTRIFIVKTLEKGGMALLVEYLKVLFGTYYFFLKT